MKKRFISLLLTICMTVGLFGFAESATYAEIKLHVFVNGKEISSPAIIVNEGTMLPVRAFAEALGAEVSWDAQTRTINIKKDGNDLSVTINEYDMYNNGEKISLDSPAMIISDIAYLPLRPFAEALGCWIEWNGGGTVNIYYSSILYFPQKPFELCYYMGGETKEYKNTYMDCFVESSGKVWGNVWIPISDLERILPFIEVPKDEYIDNLLKNGEFTIKLKHDILYIF